MEARLIDSDILIDHLRGLRAAKDFLLACSEEHDTLAISAAGGAILITRNLKDFEKVKHIIRVQKPY